ncbi:N-acetylmuramoyl-L-alanine amidase [compost metagenome]
MKQQGYFLLLDCNEFRTWLTKQKLTRSIRRLQVHHTLSPNYTTRRVVGGVAQQDHFKALEGMRDFHIKTNGWSATGQNITIFEDGKIAISLDRDLNSTPSGIAGANTEALCVEIIGNFDKGGDTMTDAQRVAVIHLYACLCDKLGITPDVTSIVYHAWYKADGTWLGDYAAGKSSKTCPGTTFWGDGNTRSAAIKRFIPDVAAELKRIKTGSVDELSVENKKRIGELELELKELAATVSSLFNSKDVLKQAIQEQSQTILKTSTMVKSLEDKSVIKKVPEWAKPAVKAAFDAGLIDTPAGGSYDFYRILKVLYTAGLLITRLEDK